MKIRVLIPLLLVALSLTSAAKKKSTPLPVPPHTAMDRNYVPALSVANRFLQAWQAEDHEAGLLLLSDSAKQKISEDRLEKYFQPGSTTLRAFQVTHGKKLKEGRYTFPVVLFERPSGVFSRSRNVQLFVVQAGKDDWVVDKLP